MRGELLEAGDGVHAEEVLVGLLVRQVELADVGLGQNGLEDVVLVGVIDDVLEDLVGVTEPAHLVMVGLKVAVHQQGMDAHTDAVLADESDLILDLVLDHLGGERECGQLSTSSFYSRNPKNTSGKLYLVEILQQ